LGFSSVLSSAGCGRMLTSSNRPMLYTASMSARACRVLYTCERRASAPWDAAILLIIHQRMIERMT